MKLLNEIQRQVLKDAAQFVVDFEGDLVNGLVEDLSKIDVHQNPKSFDEALSEILDMRNHIQGGQGFVRYIDGLSIGSTINVGPSREVVDKGLEMLADQYYDQITEPLYPGEISKWAGLSQDETGPVYSLNNQNLVILRNQVRRSVDLLTTAMDLLTEIRK